MFSFLISIVALVLGYFVYGAFVDRVFGPDPHRPTPAISKADGVDFIAMPSWKVYMIQFLNIAGTGPIFGAIMGAKFGPAATSGLCSDASLRVPSTTTCAACSLSGTGAPASRNWWETTWDSVPKR